MNQVQIQDEAVCILLCPSALRKGMNLSLVPAAIGK